MHRFLFQKDFINSRLTRRSFVQAAALAACWQPAKVLASSLSSSTSSASGDPFLLPVSQFFGITGDLKLRDRSSLYKASTQAGKLSFDVSNNAIGGCLNEHGEWLRTVAQTGYFPAETTLTPVGAYIDRLLVRGSGWKLKTTFAESEKNAGPLQPLGMDLIDNLFPLSRYKVGDLLVEEISFAPTDQLDSDEILRPEVLITLVRVSSPSGVRLDGTLTISSNDAEQAACFHETGTQEIAFNLHSNQTQVCAILYGVNRGTSEGATGRVVQAQLPTILSRHLKQMTPLELFQRTRIYHDTRLGKLIIPDDPFYAELYVRASELARQSITLTTTGKFGGSFVGSDEPPPSTVWMRDCFYAAMAQCLHTPDLAAKAIEFFLDTSIPERVFSDSPRAERVEAVSNSLSNSLSPLILSSLYYQYTADKSFYQSHPELLSRGRVILDAVLATRRFEPYLFPSLYISDGEARGDFHTGSNIAAWKAFHGMSRLAEEVYGDAELALKWRMIAQRIRSSLLEYCVLQSGETRRFAEGAMSDHSLILVHDGEESDITLQPFYGFCDTDDPFYIATAKAGVSKENPYFAASVDGIWWFAHGKWSSVTFPGWTTGLASAKDETILHQKLERIRSLTDADGSFWWWPYKYDGFNPSDVPLRAPGKCAWAASVYQCLFIRNLLGIDVDVPAKTLRVRPFVPWAKFEWRRCRLGSACFDLAYRKTESAIELEICNSNTVPFAVSFELLLPVGADCDEMTLNGAHTTLTKKQIRGRTLAVATATLQPGIRATARVIPTTSSVPIHANS